MRHGLGSALAFALVATAAGAQERRVTFQPLPLDAPLASPERGWWRFAADRFDRADPEELRAIRQDGITLGYAIVRLDDFRDGPLTEAFLADLSRSFAEAREAGLKVILRFAYNYPESSQQYEEARDAPLPVVLAQIRQLAPLLAAEADTIAVMQAGFIGAWGEGHSSSNGLDAPEAKAAIRDALLSAVPEEVPLQWRYPPDLMAWEAEGRRGRFGLHNDCFLSSPTDVGTYSEDPEERAAQRAWVAGLTAGTFFSGETCDAQPELIRTSCEAVLSEGAAFHLSALNRDYHEAFHRAWAREGCLEEVGARMGYRLRLVEARVGPDVVEVTVANDGWAALQRPRPLLLVAGGMAVPFGPAGLEAVGPGRAARLAAPLPGGLPERLCVAAPDPSPRLRDDPREAIRLANADAPGQGWEDGSFCFDIGE